MAHALARRAPIERRRDFHAHPRAAARHTRDEADVELARFLFKQAVLEAHARGGETFPAFSRFRIRIPHRGHDTRDLCAQQRIHAGRRAALVVAGLERDVDGRAARVDSLERADLCMRSAGFLVPAFADDPAVARDDAADARVRRRRVQPLGGELERAPHHGAIELGEHH